MNLKGNQDNFGFADTHEYVLVYARDIQQTVLHQFLIEDEELLKEWQTDEYGLFKVADNLRATGVNAPRHKRQNALVSYFC